MKRPRLPRLLQTTAVRLAGRYALIYAGVLGAALATLLWVESRHRDSRPVARLEEKLQALTAAFDEGGDAALLAELTRQQAGVADEDRIFLLVSANGQKRAGSLLSWPGEEPIPTNGKAHAVWIEEEVSLSCLDDVARIVRQYTQSVLSNT